MRSRYERRTSGNWSKRNNQWVLFDAKVPDWDALTFVPGKIIPVQNVATVTRRRYRRLRYSH